MRLQTLIPTPWRWAALLLLQACCAAGVAQAEPRTEPVASGLDHPWAVAFIDGGRFLVTERERAVLALIEDGERREIPLQDNDIWVSGETGLMGLEVEPDFADNRRVYTCQGWGGGEDVRVISWTLDAGLTRATPERTLIDGFPTTSGRHGGCRLLITSDGALWVGTGDAADERNPRNLDSLGGKTLRLDRRTGAPWPTNPFIHAARRATRYITSYGHRNVQGLAQRTDGTLWSIEQGTYQVNHQAIADKLIANAQELRGKSSG